MATPSPAQLLQALADYRLARRRLLDLLGLQRSNRDPVPELAEYLVALLIGGHVAPSRVQARWDVETRDGRRVQVRTLSNTAADLWVNEHLVTTKEGVDHYALVVFEDLAVSAVLLLPTHLATLNAFLGKRHSDLDTTMQFTRANFRRILDHRALVEREYGVRVWTPEDLWRLR